jgi:hypothetical protein
MILSACYGFLLFLLGVLAYCAVYRTIHQRLLLASAVFFVGRCVLYLGNHVLEFFPPKFANDWGLFWVEYHLLSNESVPTADSFAIQGLLIAPVYGLLSDPILAANAVNVAAFTLAGYAIGRFALLVAPPNKAALVFLAFNLFPAANYFVMFGLRDPVILAATTMFFCGLGRYLVGHSPRSMNGETLLGAVIMLASRPELAVIFVPSIGLIAMAVAGRKYRGSAARRIRPALYVLATLVLLPVAWVSYQAAVSDVGFGQAGITTVLEVYGEARYERQFSDKDLSGDESPIIPPDLYGRLPLPARIAMQTAGMLVLPFPWLIDRIPKALAFLDTLLYLFLLWKMWQARQTREVRYGFLVFAVALLGMGTTVSNFGNAFRMRMVLFPIVAIAAAFAVARARRTGP